MTRAALFLAGCALCAVACGCETEPTMQMNVGAPSPVASTGRFSVTRVGVFADDVAYGDRRGIYLIEDLETGQRFVGVSGVGVSELGRHSAGKTAVRDER